MRTTGKRVLALAAVTALTSLGTTVLTDGAAQAAYYQYRKCSTASTLSVFVNSTSSTTKWPHQVGFNTLMFAAQEANGRYHVSLWNDDGATNGWVSTSWVRAC
ncbi:hypothetical protein [Micromonospora sp. NBS 11-29]|uniref:hypothetical protein n=1 Tax=Micromonospora sp. NBS 11-29 TaxID=1960879 RepID=UPI001121DBFD|nr:hypothetical protein [Micromonospora sp. NBS 11-29]